MAFNSHFQHTETTLLPLPPPKTGQTFDGVAERGLSVALSLLQNHDYMIDLNPLQLHHDSIDANADQAVNVEQLAADFNVLLTEPAADTPRVNGGSEWRHYEIHEEVPVMFNYKKVIVFQTAIRNTLWGMESLTDPGSTVTVHGRYDVTKTPGDLSTLTLVERTTTHCNVVLAMYIRSTLGSSHADIHKTLKGRFCELMQK